MTNILYESNRNLRSQTRDSLSQYINNISISTMDSVRAQLGMLSLLTSQTDEISRKAEVKNALENFVKIFKLNKTKIFNYRIL